MNPAAIEPPLTHAELESPLSLFQRPLYRGSGTDWATDLMGVARKEKRLDWDLGALLSTLSLGYALGDRTLFRQISRRPWLSERTPTGDYRELPIPPHGRRWLGSREIARRLLELLEQEIEGVARRYRKISLLLSGGLDSRIVAGVVRRLLDQNRLQAEVLAVTWGIENSRDVMLGKEVATALGFTWQHVELKQEHLVENIAWCSRMLGATVSPIHLHRMKWIVDHSPPDSLVLAGSYGDSVGRGEYSKRTVLELAPLRPHNFMGLLREDLARTAMEETTQEIERLMRRAGAVPRYVHCEHQQQGHYMRGLIAQTMSVINLRCPVYQVFTHPNVYGFIWSLHPAVRTDKVYECLLRLLGRGISSIPWARTNAALDRSRVDRNGAVARFHWYDDWTRELVKQEVAKAGLGSYVESFAPLDFLEKGRLSDFLQTVLVPGRALKAFGDGPATVILWLESLKSVWLELRGIVQPLGSRSLSGSRSRVDSRTRSRLSVYFSSSSALRKAARTCRRFLVRRASVLWYRPQK